VANNESLKFLIGQHGFIVTPGLVAGIHLSLFTFFHAKYFFHAK
jgi:hypothetical protein